MLSNSKKGLVIACIDVIIVISAQNVVLPCIAEIEEIKRRKSIFVLNLRSVQCGAQGLDSCLCGQF